LVHEMPDSEPVRSGPFDRRMVRRLAEDFLSGQTEHGPLVRQLLAITVWHGATVRPTSFQPRESGRERGLVHSGIHASL
jgi:hypothetical protein